MTNTANQKTITVKELSSIMGVSESLIKKKIKELGYGHVALKNSQGGYLLNEKQVTKIKQSTESNPHIEKSNINTHLEMQEKTLEVMQYWTDKYNETKKLLKQREKQLEEARPMIAFTEQVLLSKDSIKIGDFAKIINDENIDLGRNQLFKWLRDNYYLMKDNMPYQKSINQGWVEVIERPIDTPYGIKLEKTTLITPKGQVYFTEKLRELKEVN